MSQLGLARCGRAAARSLRLGPQPELASETVFLLEEDRRARACAAPRRCAVPAASRAARTCSRWRWRSNARMTETGDSPSWKTRPSTRSTLACIALGRGHHRIVEFERGAVADREPRILELDPAAVAGIERELFELGTGQQPIAPEMLDQKLAGVAARGHPMRRQGLPDHRSEVARRIGVAADRDGRPAPLRRRGAAPSATAGRRPRRRSVRRRARSREIRRTISRAHRRRRARAPPAARR